MSPARQLQGKQLADALMAGFARYFEKNPPLARGNAM